MKKTILNLLISFFCVISFRMEAQKVMTLKIMYDITYPAKMPSLESMSFNKAITLYHGTSTLTKQVTPYDDITTTISTNCGKTNLTSLGSLPYLLKTVTRDSSVADKTEKTLTNETKLILGHPCKKVKLETKVANATYTNYLYIYEYKNPAYCSQTIAGITGLTLGMELDISGGGAIQVWTAKSLSEELLDSVAFVIPSDNTILTMEEYTQKLTTDKVFRDQTSAAFRLSAMSGDLKKNIDEIKRQELITEQKELKKQRRREAWNAFALGLLDAMPAVFQAVSDISGQIDAAINNNSAITKPDIQAVTAGGNSCPEGEAILKQMQQRCGHFNTVSGGSDLRGWYNCQADVTEEAKNTCVGKMSAADLQAFQKTIDNLRHLALEFKR